MATADMACSGVLKFSDKPPYGVVAPPSAAQTLGSSLCCARAVVVGAQLSQLQEALIALPKVVAWGDYSSPKHRRSRRKFAWLDGSARSRLEPALISPNAANPTTASALREDEASMASLQAACPPWLATQLAAPFGVSDTPLAFQPNFQHDDFPLHYDDPASDGFGRTIVTLNAKERTAPKHPLHP